jgi:hypothetical protein
MRLWSLHPRYLDQKGLVALWREGLLAQKVLLGQTKGYTNHPQLLRFRSHGNPLSMISAYLNGVCDEAWVRGYRFDRARIIEAPCCGQVEESAGQLLFEWAHLLAKLERRAPALHDRYFSIESIEAHPLFRIVPGGKKEWERG